MIQALIMLALQIIVLGVIWYLLQWAIDYVGLPEPFNRVAKVVLVVVAILILIMLLLKFAGIAGIAIG